MAPIVVMDVAMDVASAVGISKISGASHGVMAVAMVATGTADVVIDLCVVIVQRAVPAVRPSPWRLHPPVAVLPQTVVEPSPTVP